MRDRLVELLCNVKCEGEECFGNCPHRIGQKCNKVQRLEMCSVFAIADHLLAESVIALPCKFGQTVFVICNTVERIQLEIENCIYETKIDHISIGAKGAEFHLLYRCITHPDCDWFVEKDIGKTVFLTREDAERAFAKRS